MTLGINIPRTFFPFGALVHSTMGYLQRQGTMIFEYGSTPSTREIKAGTHRIFTPACIQTYGWSDIHSKNSRLIWMRRVRYGPHTYLPPTALTKLEPRKEPAKCAPKQYWLGPSCFYFRRGRNKRTGWPRGEPLSK
jgi:hypothetical protein